jgi:hypothetical protein
MSFLALLLPLLTNAEVPAGTLDGLWRQACERSYFREELFLGSSAVYTERNFRDGACLSPSVDTISRGQILPGSLVAEPIGASELDFIFESVSLLPRDERAAEAYEKISLCGLKGWIAGEEKEITGLLCDLYGQGSQVRVPQKGLHKYGVVRVGEDALYFGRLSPERDGSSALKRPLVLDASPYKRAR